MQRYNYFFLLPIVVACLFSCKNPPPPKYTETIQVTQVDSLLEKNPEIILIDVRTPSEHADGSIPNSLNIDVENDSFGYYASQLDTLSTYLIYCRSGKRSSIAVGEMEQIGFRYMFNLDGGYLAWSGEE